MTLVVALALAAPTACSNDGPDAGEARLEVDGEALVERAGGDRDTIDGTTNLHRGDRVSVHDGSAVMRLAGGTVLELREGFDEAADTALVMGDRPELEAGELLITTPEAVDLEADGTEVHVADGAARLTRAFGMSVAAYDAEIVLDSAGVPAEVPALRQMVVPDLGRPPQSPRPITYDDADTWDRRFLGAAMALGGRLEDFADGLTSNLPEGEGRTPGFFRLVLPGLDDEGAFDAELLADRLDREPGDTLIGAAISDLGERGAFADRWSAVFSFRDAGAAWGIVALDQAVRSGPLIGSVEDALNTSFAESAFAPPPATSTPGPSATPPATPAGPGGADVPISPGSPGGGPSTSPPTAPPPTTPPITPPVTPPPALEPVVNPGSDLLDGLVGGLLGGLLGPGG